MSESGSGSESESGSEGTGTGILLTEAGVTFVTDRHLAILTTLGPVGQLHSVPVGFTLEEGIARIISSDGTQKVRNAERSGQASVAQVDGARWLSFQGSSRVVRDADAVAHAVELYAGRYRQPGVNPRRVVVEIAVERALGSSGMVERKSGAAPAPAVDPARGADHGRAAEGRGSVPPGAPGAEPTTIPIVRTFPGPEATAFYVDYLGFTLDWEHRFEPGLPLYRQVSRGDCVLHLSEHHGDATPGSAVRVRVQDLAGFRRALQQKTYPLRPGIQNQPWGLDMVLDDPFGNRIIFTESLPDQVPDERPGRPRD